MFARNLPLISSAIALSLASAQAATITWGTPTTVTADTDVSLNGTLISATTWGAGDGNVVNGVTFAGNNDNAIMAVTKNSVTNQALGFDATGTSVSAPFEAILDSFAYDGANPKVLTLSTLTLGNVYEIQLFVSDDRGCCGARTQQWSDSATLGTGNDTPVFAQTDSTYTIGTFTATASTQLIYGHGVDQGQNGLNAAVLRDVTIPEPSAFALIGLAGAGLMLRRRR